MLTKRKRARKIVKRLYANAYLRKSDTKVVFVFGEMRSGTNMLIGCLERSFSVAAFNENDAEAFDDYVLMGSDRISEIAARSGALAVAFKCIADSQRARELLDSFPDSRAVWIFRHYNDVVNSAIRKWKEHNDYIRYILEESPKAGWRGINVSQSMRALLEKHYSRGLSEQSARALIWYFRNLFFYEQSLNSVSRIELVNYEDATRSPRLIVGKLFDHLQIPFRPGYVSHVSSSSVGRDTPPEIDASVKELCDELYARLYNEWVKRQGMAHAKTTAVT